jgi:hypothetical protein
MIITAEQSADRIRLIAIEMKGAFGNEGALPLFVQSNPGLMLDSGCRRLGPMPTVLRIGPYRFHFYSRESNEPAHIHVSRDDFEAKFWLRPISVAFNYGFPSTEVNDIRRLVEENCDFLLAAYRQFHGDR